MAIPTGPSHGVSNRLHARIVNWCGFAGAAAANDTLNVSFTVASGLGSIIAQPSGLSGPTASGLTHTFAVHTEPANASPRLAQSVSELHCLAVVSMSTEHDRV